MEAKIEKKPRFDKNSAKEKATSFSKNSEKTT